MKIGCIKWNPRSWSKVAVPACMCAVIASCLTPVTALGEVTDSLVIPNEYGETMGPGLGTTIEGLQQYTYLNSQFESIGDQEITINSIALRHKLDGPGSSLDVVVPAITISMGTFSKQLSQLSAIASNNRGADFIRVYSHDDVALHFVPAGDPNNFSLVFKLDTPFSYNPKNGHLIFEWQAATFSGRPDARVDFAAYFPPQGPV